jgi:hypothetical protein
MKANNANQRVARDLAETRESGGFDQRARDLRAENAKRAAAATRKLAEGPNLEWLDRATRSVPAYEVQA